MLDPQYVGEESEVIEAAEAGGVVPPRPRALRPARPRRIGAAEEYSARGESDASLSHLRRKAGLLYRVASWVSIRLAPLYGALYDAQMQLGKGVRTSDHRVQLPNFPTGAPPLRAAFLSDLHYGPTTGRNALRQAWKIARDARPDVVFLGGDYLYADERGLPVLLRELQRWQHDPPPGGIYACLGNHDYYAGRETIQTCLKACGVRVLVNDAAPLPTPWKGVWIAGVDDPWCGEPDLKAALKGVSQGASTLLLAHNPDICEDTNMRRCAITLCGHTHGGQVCLPSGDPLHVPAKHGKEYSSGLFRHAGQWLFVSRGVGTVGLPIRLFCPPEVALFEFTGRASSRAASRSSNSTSRAVPFVPKVS
jgi:predicted MPP superfamily phosphohydrolase